MTSEALSRLKYRLCSKLLSAPKDRANFLDHLLNDTWSTAEGVDDLLTELQAVDVRGSIRSRQLTGGTTFRRGTDALPVSIYQPDPPWAELPANPPALPGMLSPEECRSYRYLARLFQGAGEVVELGPWLGFSTCVLLEELCQQPAFDGKQLHVYDDFTWRSDWMENSGLDPARHPQDGASFRSLFDEYTQAFADRIDAKQIRLPTIERLDANGQPEQPSPGYHEIPLLSWPHGPIELCIVDVGRALDVNEAWWNVLSPHFISGVTLVVMQDWGTHRTVPRKSYNQTKIFTDSKRKTLQLVHELMKGNVATFLYHGESEG